MPEPVSLDNTVLSGLTSRVAQAADELGAVPIPAVEGLPGSALADVDGPRHAAADVRRLAAACQAWVAAARRSGEELAAADGAGADRLKPR
jgi:hypothetical protein